MANNREFLLLQIDDTFVAGACCTLHGVRRQPRLGRTVHVTAAASSTEAIVAAIQQVASALDVDDDVPLCLALGDRRCSHFVLRLPEVAPRTLPTIVEREARRQGSLAADVRLRHGIRALRRNGRLQEFAVTVLPSDAYESLATALEERSLRVVGATSIEDATLAALPGDHPDAFALITRSGNRLRYVHCQHGAVVQVRRIIAPDLEDPMMVATHLALEVPRTVDFLEQTGWRAARALLLDPGLGLSGDVSAMLGTESCPVEQLPNDADRLDGEGSPAAMCLRGLANRLQARDAAWSLTNEFAPRLRRSVRRVVLRAGVAAALLGFVSFAGWSAYRWYPAHRELRSVERRLADLNFTVPDPIAASASPSDSTEARGRALERRWLERRRPVSQLLAKLMDSVTPEVFLDGVSLDGKKDEIVLTGWAESSNRRQCLEHIARTLAAVRKLGLIKAKDESVTPIPDGPIGRLRFTVRLQWRPKS